MDFREECFRFACELSLTRRTVFIALVCGHGWGNCLDYGWGGVWLSVGGALLKQVGSGL